MSTTLATWMKLGATAVVIAALIWGLLIGDMRDIANVIAKLMGGAE